MEPISYLRAPLRRWPVVLPFVVVLAIVAVLIPYSSKSKYPPHTWEAASDVGLAPAFPGNKLGAKLGIKQLEFYAHQPAVLAAAAKAENESVTKHLTKDVVVTKGKVKGGGKGSSLGIKGDTISVAVLQKTKAKAVSFTNAFVVALGSYSQLQLTAQQKSEIASDEAYIQNLETAIKNLPHKTKPTTSTTTTHPTTTVPHHTHHTHHAKATTKPKAAPNLPAPSNVSNNPASTPATSSTSSTSSTTSTTSTQSGSSSTPASTSSTTSTQSGASLSAYSPSSGAAAQKPRIELVEEPAPATTPTSSPLVTPQTVPGQTVPVVIVPTPFGTVPGQFGVTTTTTEPFSKLLQTQQIKVLTNEIARTQANLLKVQAQGPPKSGLRVVAKAMPGTAEN